MTSLKEKDNHKNIKIEANEDIVRDDKIKEGVKALAKKPYKETSAEYKVDSE
jgi:hypothetical protein